MTLPPITAQILDIPPDITQLGQVVIIAAALLGVVYAIRPLISGFVGSYKELASVNRELLRRLESSDAVIDRNTAQAAKTETGVSELAQSVAKLAETQSQLVKSLPDAIAQFVKASEAAADRTIDAVNKANSLREGEILAGLARVEASVASLREEIASGQKAHRVEVLGKIDRVLAELSAMKPVPPTPPTAMHIVPKPEEEAA